MERCQTGRKGGERGKAMYCEKCKRIFEEEKCPVCRHSRVRNPEPGDLCFLTEQDYVSSGILEDVLKQDGIPYLRKAVMGAGMAVKVGPMLDRGRFYVMYEKLPDARAVVEELFTGIRDEAGAPADQE